MTSKQDFSHQCIHTITPFIKAIKVSLWHIRVKFDACESAMHNVGHEEEVQKYSVKHAVTDIVSDLHLRPAGVGWRVEELLIAIRETVLSPPLPKNPPYFYILT